jgi:hypothetical protein
MNDTNANIFVSFFCILAFCVPFFVCLCYCNMNSSSNNSKMVVINEKTSILSKV